MNRNTPMTGVLRPDVELIRGDSMLLFDRQKDAYYKVDGQTLNVISFLSESMPVDLFLSHLRKNGIVIDRENLLAILDFLRRNNLLLPTSEEMLRKRDARREYRNKNRMLRLASAYLFFRLPPWRPGRFLKKAAPFMSFLASGKPVAFYVVVALAGYLLLIRDFGNAVAEFGNTLSWYGLVKYFLAIAAVKCIHEFAHALAAVHFHCRIRGIGVGFMFFCPRLFTDTTDSWRLPRKQRLLIDGAGIIAEFLIGGWAALCWSFLPPGALRSTMFYILTVSTLSTFVINGNPLIKYDGYYIFCDLIGEDNLMGRAANVLQQCWRRFFLRIGEAPDPAADWKLICFGICSFLYRIFLYTSIILVIYHKFNRVLAAVMIVLEIYAVLLYPLGREIKAAYKLAKADSRRRLLLPGIILIVLLYALLMLPLGWTEELRGEIGSRYRDLAAVREAGFLAEDVSCQEVKKDDILCRLNSPKLQFARMRIEKKYLEETVLLRLQKQDEKHFPEVGLTLSKLKSLSDSMRETVRRERLLTVRSPSDGTFVPLSREMRAGKFLPKGAVLGHVFSREKIVIAYADDQQLGKLAAGQNAEILLRGKLSAYHGVIRTVNMVPAAFEPSALLLPFGGTIPVSEPRNHDAPIRPMQSLYRIEIDLTDPDCDLCHGQVVKVCVRKNERLATALWRIVMSIWRKEIFTP